MLLRGIIYIDVASYEGRWMPGDRAFDLMKSALEAVLPSVDVCIRGAKSVPARRKLAAQIEQIKEAVEAAEQAGPLSRPSQTRLQLPR